MAIAPVVLEFLAKGTPNVSASIRNVSDSIARAEKKATQDAERAARERKRIAEREARDKVLAWAKADREITRIQEKAARETAKAAAAQEREIAKSARERVRIESAAAREVERIQERAHRNAKRAIQQEERERDAAARRWVRQQESAQQAAQKARVNFVTSVAGAGARGVAAGVGRVAQTSMGLVQTAAQLGGGFSIADSVAKRAELDRAAALLSNSAIGVNGVTAAKADPKKIVARAQAAAIATGVDAGELIKATQSYVAKSSDFEGGMGNMEFFGKLSKATGADLGDIAKAAGLIRSQNKNLDTEGMKNMLLAVVQQGKQGSVELEDLAKSAGKMTRTATSFAGDQSANQQRLLGLSQIAVRTTGSPEGAAVALSALGSDTRGHHKELSRALGYDVLDAGGKIVKSPEELLADLMGATGGNLAALGQRGGLGFTKPTMKIFEALKPTFDEAQQAYLKSHPGDTKGANAAGSKAALDEMRQITGSTMGMGQLDEMSRRVMGSSAEQLERAMQRLRTEVGDALLPEFLKLVPVIKESTPAFVTLLREGVPAFTKLIKSVSEFVAANQGLVQSFAAHPIAALIGIEITKSFAAAALPELLRNIVTRAMSGGGAASAVPGVGGGAGAAGNAGPIAAAMAAQGYGIYSTITSVTDAKAEGTRQGNAVAAMLSSGDQGQMAEGGRILAEAQKNASGANVAAGYLDRAGRIASLVTNPLGAVAGYGADAATEALGIKGQGTRAIEAIKARDLVNAPDLQKVITDTIANGVREGVRQGTSHNSGPGGEGRREPIINR